jgi:hypothetical protein
MTRKFSLQEWYSIPSFWLIPSPPYINVFTGLKEDDNYKIYVGLGNFDTWLAAAEQGRRDIAREDPWRPWRAG